MSRAPPILKCKWRPCLGGITKVFKMSLVLDLCMTIWPLILLWILNCILTWLYNVFCLIFSLCLTLQSLKRRCHLKCHRHCIWSRNNFCLLLLVWGGGENLISCQGLISLKMLFKSSSYNIYNLYICYLL